MLVGLEDYCRGYEKNKRTNYANIGIAYNNYKQLKTYTNVHIHFEKREFPMVLNIIKRIKIALNAKNDHKLHKASRSYYCF